jgi:internalin A
MTATSFRNRHGSVVLLAALSLTTCLLACDSDDDKLRARDDAGGQGGEAEAPTPGGAAGEPAATPSAGQPAQTPNGGAGGEQVGTAGEPSAASAGGSPTLEVGCVFEDDTLEASVRSALAQPEGPLLPETAATLTTLSASPDITTIAGIECLTGLVTLQLNGNQITDLTPLSGLTELESLHLTDSEVSDISVLANLTELRTLSFVNNPVSDLSPLSGLTKLEGLVVDGSNVSDLAPLSTVTSLVYFEGARTALSDLSPLSALPNFENLDVSATLVDETTDFSGFSNLRRLRINDSALTALPVLTHITSLWDIDVRGNDLADLSSLVGTSISQLNVMDNPITDWSDLAQLPSLTFALVNGTDAQRFSSFDAFAVSTSLTSFYVEWADASDLSFLASTPSLFELTILNSSQPIDLASIGAHTQLEYLYIAAVGASDLTPLASLTSINTLYIPDNPFSDVSPLVANTGLGAGDHLDISACPNIDCEAQKSNIAALIERGVSVATDCPVP